ncbi:MAG: YidC/Oxa1 family rane protein insertase [Pseudomonadota bacterium]|nr:YidC/Oxa1 family rane protein insertase [Pseudomonadota bacterium]
MNLDNLRIISWAGLLILIWLSIQSWQQMFQPQAPAALPATTALSADPGAVPTAAASNGVPALPGAAAPVAQPATPAAQSAAAPARLISVHTGVLDVEIDLNGGDLSAARLPTYPVHKDQPDVPLQLLNSQPDAFFVIQSGLRAADQQPEPNHLTEYTAAGTEFVLADGADELVVPLQWQSPIPGLSIEKVFRFHRNSFRIDLEYTVHNQGSVPYRAAKYVQLQRHYVPPERSMFDVESYSYYGPVIYDGSKYEKLDVEDLAGKPATQSVENGWLAAIQHHFLAAAVPLAAEPWTYEARFAEGRFLISAIGPLQTVAPGASASFKTQLFVGPKMQEQLAAIAPGLDLTVDYGAFALLAQPLFWIIQKIHGFVGNWGLAIIICTLLIKLVFYKLSETSGRSMARMRQMQPRMKALQERYKDDKQALSTAMMDLYKKEKINPAAGCLPMLVQIPFFMAFYWVLLESVEMRQAPFMLWITDLSSRDPYFVLPLLMGVAMWFQQKLNPPPPDPVQAKMMQAMPILMTGMFAFFPAGLVLYWLTNSVLSIAQQWRINKVLGAN